MVDYKKKYLKYKTKYLNLIYGGTNGFAKNSFNIDLTQNLKQLNINNYILEGCPIYPFQISELKSSFLVRNLLINTNTNKYIISLYNKYLINLYKYLSIDINDKLNDFFDDIGKTKIVHDIYNKILYFTSIEKRTQKLQKADMNSEIFDDKISSQGSKEITVRQARTFWKSDELIEETKFIEELKLFYHNKAQFYGENHEHVLMFFEEDLYKTPFLDYWNDINNAFFYFYEHYMDKTKVNILPVTNIFIYYDQSDKNPQNFYQIIQSDFYALYTFSYWTWTKFYTEYDSSFTNNYNYKNFNSTLFVGLTQQKINNIANIIRGTRTKQVNNSRHYIDDFTTTLEPNVYNNDKILTSNIGISNSLWPSLEREVFDQKIPWLHPGTKSCNVILNGAYGKTLLNKSLQSYYSSYQCSISGSCNFTYFPFLISLFDNQEINLYAETKDFYQSTCNFIIICATLSMVGDGGHNFREVLFGLTLSNLCTYYYIRYLIDEIILFIIETQVPLNSIYTKKLDDEFILLNIQTILSHFKIIIEQQQTVDTKFKLLTEIYTYIDNNKPEELNFNKIVTEYIKNIVSIYPLVDYFYTYTQHINFISITNNDIKSLDQQFISNFNAKQWFISHMTDYIPTKIEYDIDEANHAQYFFAIDSNRFNQPEEVWEKCVDDIWNNILEELQFNPSFDDLKEILEHCEYNDLDVNSIPLA